MAEDDLLALRQLYEEFANGNFGKGSELFAPDVVFEPFPERSAIPRPREHHRLHARLPRPVE